MGSVREVSLMTQDRMEVNQILEVDKHCRSKNKYPIGKFGNVLEVSLESEAYRLTYDLLMCNLPHTLFQKIEPL